MTRTHRLLAGSISVVLTSCLGAALVQTSCGRVRVYDVKIPTQNGQWVVGDLFKPDTATRKNP
ncbi:MAG: hypothetical protein H6Q87_1959, partial [candidate division NC10 bacterium]|nr:hypothetical protein [candidate division NC10 bacterium]